MNRRKQFIAFAVSALVTIGLWMAFHGRPHYAHHCHGQHHNTEQCTADQEHMQ